MADKDFYEILGVSRNANDDEIKNLCTLFSRWKNCEKKHVP